MNQILPPELNDVEFQAMRSANGHIPSSFQFRLKDIGYAKETSGFLVLTDDGLQRWRGAMTDKHPKRPKDTNQLAKSFPLDAPPAAPDCDRGHEGGSKDREQDYEQKKP